MDFKENDISLDDLHFLPESRRNALNEIYSDSDKNVKQLVKKYGKSCKVFSTKIIKDAIGRRTAECSYYSPDKKAIFMNEFKDNEEYALTFCHEFGHYIDDALGKPSISENFEFALQADKQWVNLSNEEGLKSYKAMLTELANSSVIDNRYVSDVLSGMFLNDKYLQIVYNAAGSPFYGHHTLYWLGSDGPDRAVNIEVFADLMGIYSENDAETVAFIEKWFPNTATRFKKIIKGAIT